MIGTVWPLVVAAVSLGIDAYVLAGVLPQIADSLTATVGAIGLGVTAFTGAYAVAGPLLSGRFVAGSTRRGLLVALGVFNAGNLITAVAPNLEVFLASRVLSGVGAGVLTALATSAAAALVATERRGRAMALVTFGLSAGTVAGVPTGMLIGHHVGWRWTMGLVVAVGLVSMLAVLLRSQAMPPLDAGGARVAVILTPQVAIGVALAFVFGLASLGLYTYLLPMAAERGVGSWGFTFVWAWGVGGVAGSMVAGPLIDGLGSRRLLPGVAVLLVASFAALALLDGPAAWLVAIALWGACGWGGVPVLQDVLTRSRQERTTSVVAFQMAAMYLGASAGSALGSAFLGAGTSAGDLPLAATATGVLAVPLAFLVLGSRRTRAGGATPSEPESRAQAGTGRT